MSIRIEESKDALMGDVLVRVVVVAGLKMVGGEGHVLGTLRM